MSEGRRTSVSQLWSIMSEEKCEFKRRIKERMGGGPLSSVAGGTALSDRQGSGICFHHLFLAGCKFPFTLLQSRDEKGNLASAFPKLRVLSFPPIHFPYLFSQDKNTCLALLPGLS